MSRQGEGEGDQLKTVKQIATYLNVNERTVLKLVSEGVLPALRVGNQWRFRRSTVDAWLDDQMLGLTPRVLQEGPKPSPDRLQFELSGCFGPGQVLADLRSATRNAVVEELAGFAHALGLVRDRTWFMGALIERENVMPTAMRNGVAFLHTLRRHPEQVIRPFMVLGRSTRGIDFGALDGKPTHLFFVLGLHYQELHLPWLSKLSGMLGQPGAVETLLAAPDAQAIHDRLIEAERSLG